MNTYQQYRHALALGYVRRLPTLHPDQYIGLYAGVEDSRLRRNCLIYLDTILRGYTQDPVDVSRLYDLPDWVGEAFVIKRDNPNMTFDAVLDCVDVEWWNLPALADRGLKVCRIEHLREFHDALAWLNHRGV